MSGFLQDVRYGVRGLMKSPAFTAVAVITLAIGIGANTSILSVAEGIWLNPLPFTDSSSLMRGGEITPEGGHWTVAAATFRAWQEQAHSFSGMAAFSEEAANVSGIALPQRVSVARVTPEMFHLLDSQPLIGRLWTADEQTHGSFALLSYSEWQSHFGADPSVIGRSIVVNGKPVSIIGIMPVQFNFPPGDELWMPLEYTPADWADATGHRLHVIARVRPGRSLEQANRELAAISKALAHDNPAAYRERLGAVLPLRDYLNGNLTPIALRVMFVLVGFVLLIAWVNVSGLQLARASARRREFALRAAIGARGWRFAEQLLIESMVLAGLGTALGVVLAYAADRLIVAGLPADIARQIAGWSNLGLDRTTLLVTIAAAVFASVISGVAPAISSARVIPVEALKGQTTSEAKGALFLRNVLIGAEAALALILVSSTALVLSGFKNIMSSVERFEPKHVVTAHVDFTASTYSDPAKRTAFIEAVLGRLSAAPGANIASAFTSTPFSNNGVLWEAFSIPGRPPARSAPHAIIQAISPDFYALMKIPLVSGRAFSESDGTNTLPVAVVSEAFVRKFWPKESPIGKTIELKSGDSKTLLNVVGVASDVEYDWTDNEPEAVIYRPVQQAPPTSIYFAVRTASSPVVLVPEIRSAFSSLDHDLPADILSLAGAFWQSLSPVAEIEGLMGVFGIIALILAAVGVYGTVAFSVARRTREIAIRMAVGAQRCHILGVVIRRSMSAVALGVGFGIIGALFMGRVVGSFYFGTAGLSVWTMATAIVALTTTAIVASFIPARHAATVDPIEALRYA